MFVLTLIAIDIVILGIAFKKGSEIEKKAKAKIDDICLDWLEKRGKIAPAEEPKKEEKEDAEE